MELPEWHEISHRYNAAQVVNLGAIAELPDAPGYAALRSYATGRREHSLLGPMPAPIARIANRRLWLLADIQLWLIVPMPKWRRTKRDIERWIAAGRPRVTQTGATLPDDGSVPPTA